MVALIMMETLTLSLLLSLLACYQIVADVSSSLWKVALHHHEASYNLGNKTHEKRNFEFVIPNPTNPNGGKAKPTLSEQIDENAKYLKTLHQDLMRQVDIVNNETIEQQPMDKDLVNKSLKYPQKIKLEPLTRLFPNLLKQPLPNVLLNPNNVLLDPNHLGIQRDKIGKKQPLPNASLNLNQLGNHRDLIGNMNIAGNMGHLKKLMKHMANDVFTANQAMNERQRKKQKEGVESLTKPAKTKAKEK